MQRLLLVSGVADHLHAPALQFGDENRPIDPRVSEIDDRYIERSLHRRSRDRRLMAKGEKGPAEPFAPQEIGFDNKNTHPWIMGEGASLDDPTNISPSAPKIRREWQLGTRNLDEV